MINNMFPSQNESRLPKLQPVYYGTPSNSPTFINLSNYSLDVLNSLDNFGRTLDQIPVIQVESSWRNLEDALPDNMGCAGDGSSREYHLVSGVFIYNTIRSKWVWQGVVIQYNNYFPSQRFIYPNNVPDSLNITFSIKETAPTFGTISFSCQDKNIYLYKLSSMMLWAYDN